MDSTTTTPEVPGRRGGPDRSQKPSGDTAPRRLSRRVVAVLAVTSGAAVANLYYAQPLLDRIAGAFHVSDSTAGLLVSATQLGYVAGLALLVPLGDLQERRRLICLLLLCAAALAAVCAAAPTFSVLTAALLVLGATAVVAQIVVPLSSTLAAPHEQGRVVGTVMSGLLIGILCARTLSGIVAGIAGWRVSFWLAAGLMVILCLVLRRALPEAPPTERVPYRQALRSVLSLIAAEPVLRERMLIGGLGFAGFSVLWTSIAFLLSGSPYHYGEAVIGLFGLAGAAGAIAAPVAGRIADRGHGRLGSTTFLACILVSWGLLALGRSSLPALIAGIVVLDLGIQGAHISNQAVIYGLNAEARSRLTTAYMVAVFLGGLGGSVLSATVYGSDGWSGVCWLGAAVAAACLAAWALTQRTAA